ncbi:MAG: hypothetical protein JO112_12760, partial [Planctomycetes bacterium]|nr:hypothetical protein [Planctomycetota bacterium]
EVFMAVRRAGPRGLQLIEEAGEHSRPVARLLAAHGEEGAVFVASRPSAMRLLLEHGDEAANVLVKTRGVAEPAVASLGEPAVRAFGALTTRQDARLLAMMAAEGGELEKIGRTPELLGVIEKYGPKAMHFIWDHKGALAVTAGLTAFLANPEPFLNGAKDLTKVVAEDAVKPLAEVPAIAAKEGAAEVARKTNWTLLFLVALVALILLVAAKWGLFPRRAAVLPAALRPRLPPAPARPPPEAGLAPETGEDFSRLNP